ncbi:MAG: hypothetical protein PVF74_13490 [Anaerolineales bacterium]|jgi:hypothetical protein
MNRQRGLSIIGGLLLVLLGGWFLAVQLVPGLEGWFNIELSWPLLIIGTGVFLLLFGLVIGAPGMAVPACIVGGIGILLYWQNATGNWESWAYAWALIPGFVGIGVILAGLLEGNFRQALGDGGWLIIISLVMFVVFGSLLGGLNLLGDYWPVLLILLGLWMLIRLLLRPRRSVE